MRFLLAFLFFFSEISYGQTTGKQIEFNSVNGADYFTNYVISPSAKKNASSATASSATVTRDTTAANNIDGTASYSVDASAQNGYVEFTLGTVYEPAISGNCEFKGVFKGDATLYKAQILDGSANVLNSTAVLTNETSYRPFSVTYPCAASGSRKVRITQTEAGTGAAINVGKLYYGQITNLQAGVPNNVFSAEVSQTGVVSGENEDFFNGNCTTTLTSRQTCSFGTSKFLVTPKCTITINDGNTTTWRIVSQSTSQIVFETLNNAGASIAAAVNINCTRAGTDFIQPAITPAQWNRDWTAFTPTFTGLGTVSSEGFFWKKQDDSMCIKGTVVSGTVDATSFSMTLPNSLQIDANKNPSTTNTASHGLAYNVTSTAGNPSSGSGPYVVFSDTAVNANLLYISKTNSGASFAKSAGNALAGNTERLRVEACGIPIVGWTTSQNAPQLLGSITSNASSALRDEYLAVESDCTTATCTIARQSGAFTSVTRSSAGVYTINYPSGTWSSSPICTHTANNNESRFNAYPSATSFGITELNSSGTPTDGGMHVRCIGPR